MKRFPHSFTLLGLAAVIAVACTEVMDPGTSPPDSRKISPDIGVASAAQLQVCIDGVSPVTAIYTLDASNVSNLYGNEILNTGANQSITPGNCIVVLQKQAESDIPSGSGLYPPASSTPVVTANLPGTWTYSCVSPEPVFCPAPPQGPGNSALLQANFFHGATITFHFQPEETACPAGEFAYSFNASGDLMISYDQFPAPNDNSYGVNAVGWQNHHRFKDLVGSDKAGFQLKDGNGDVRLSFNVDYISAESSAPSGYASLGVNGGDGKMIVGTSDGISATTSLAKNLNNINIPGLFNASHVQQFGSVDLLVDSPPTDAAHTTYNISDPALSGWDFRNTYFVTISAAKLASIGFDPATWTVGPNESQLHNSPAKDCRSISGSGGACNLSASHWEAKGKSVKVKVANGGDADVMLTEVALTWPVSNGKLKKIKIGKDVVYDKPDISGGTANLTLADLVSEMKKRKIKAHKDEVVTFEFEHDVGKDLSKYIANLVFGDCPVALLPH